MAYTPDQRRNIALAKRMSRNDPPRVRQALLEAMAVESNFRNINYGDRDSLGVLQQRPSQGWKNPTHVPTAINSFLTRARRNNQGFRGTAGQLAQSVQRSAFPDRYDQRGSQANELLRSKIGGSGKSPAFQLASSVTGAQGLSGPSQGGNYRQQAAAFLLAQSVQLAQGGSVDPNGILALAQIHDQADPAQPGVVPTGARGPAGGGGPAKGGKGINELFYDPLGAIKNNSNIAPIGGHRDHVHFALGSLRAQLAAEQKARAMGLHVGEEQDSDTHRVHTSTSYHYKNFGGTKYRKAADVSGDPSKMAAYYRWIQSNYRKR